MTSIELTPAQSPEQTTELCYLEPGNLSFFEHGANLRLTVQGDRSYLKLSLVRAFPLSDPNRYFSVRSGDSKEVGMIVEPSALPADAKRLVYAAIDKRYLVPVIKKITTIKERFGTLDWDVETTRGRCKFTTRNLRENSTKPSPGRYLISDVDGNRFDLPSLNALDMSSQSIIMEYL